MQRFHARLRLAITLTVTLASTAVQAWAQQAAPATMYDSLHPLSNYISKTRPVEYKPGDELYKQWEELLYRPHRFNTVVSQDFLATAGALDSVRIMIGGTCEFRLRIRDIQDNKVLAEKTAKHIFAVEGGDTTVKFKPPLVVRPGDFYRVEIEPATRTEPLRCYVSQGNHIPFGHFTYRDAAGKLASLEGSRARHDLALEIVGHDFVSTTATSQPSKRALLVLLDRPGIIRQVAGLRAVLVAAYLGEEVSVPVEYVKSNGETLADLLNRRSDLFALRMVARTCFPLPEKFRNTTIDEFDFTPTPEYDAAVAEQTRKADLFLPTLLNLDNWRVETRSVEDLGREVREKIEEEFTAERIQARGKGKYDSVVVLEGSEFRADKVLAKIKEMAPTYRLDLHVLAEGRVDGIVAGASESGRPALLNLENFFIPFKRACLRGAIPPNLAEVYQCNSYGGRFESEWRSIGVQFVSGNLYENYVPYQYLGGPAAFAGLSLPLGEDNQKLISDWLSRNQETASAPTAIPAPGSGGARAVNKQLPVQKTAGELQEVTSTSPQVVAPKQLNRGGGMSIVKLVLVNGTVVMARLNPITGETWVIHTNSNEWVKVQESGRVATGDFHIALNSAAQDGSYFAQRFDRRSGTAWYVQDNTWIPIAEPPH